MWKIKNASRAKKLNTSQYLSRLNVRRIIILLQTLVIINMKSCSIIRKLVSFWSYIYNCDRHFSWNMWSKPLKKHSNRKKAVLNLCGVMIYNIVDGLSKLLCDPLPYLKTKKTIWSQHMRSGERQPCTIWNWFVIDVVLQCHSFIFWMFELLIWIIKNIKWRKVNEKSCTARPIIFVEDSVDSRPFVLQFAKKFLSNYYSLSFKERNVLVLILCCYLYYYLP